MRKKCNYCGKKFNATAFGEEYCPYCGSVLSEHDRQKIRKIMYYEKKIIFAFTLIFLLAILFICMFF